MFVLVLFGGVYVCVMVEVFIDFIVIVWCVMRCVGGVFWWVCVNWAAARDVVEGATSKCLWCLGYLVELGYLMVLIVKMVVLG